ncbi:MAG: hypothetical protein LUC29_00225 [Acidaminococcaceae bacterium]|nr:hypothetical protein [Acidaminococcaceae bacterium]
MRKYFSSKRIFVCLLLMLLVFTVSSADAARALRQKSSVVLVFNNIAATRYDDKLTVLAVEKLRKKLDGIYIEIEAEPYLKNFQGKSFENKDFAEITEQVQGCSADYFVYAELQPFRKETHFDLVYYDKNMKAALVLRILDLKNMRELYNKKYVMKAEDSTDYFFIGSGSVAKKALEAVLFRAGEAISVKLPL